MKNQVWLIILWIPDIEIGQICDRLLEITQDDTLMNNDRSLLPFIQFIIIPNKQKIHIYYGNITL